MISNPEILFVDDSKTIRRLAEKILSEKYAVVTCADGDEAWAKLRTNLSIKIVFTDINMKGMNGTELLTTIRESKNSRIAAMPVIMITGASDTEAMMRKVFELGATDFIAKPFKGMDLLSRAYSYIKLSDQVNNLEQRLGLDKLTGLANKETLKQHAVKFLAFSHRHKSPLSIAYLDIVGFDAIVAKYGNRVAAQILTAISSRLQSKVRSEDVTARIGTNRLVVLLPACATVKAQFTIKRLISDLHKIPFKLGGEYLNIKIIGGMTSTDLNDSKVSLQGILSQASQSVTAALHDESSDFIVYNEQSHASTLKKDMINLWLAESIGHIVEDKFDKVSDEHAILLRDKMNAFFKSRRAS